MFNRKILVAGFTAAALVASAAPALAGGDTFNRTNLGNTWVSNGVSISADQLVGSSPGYGYQPSASKETAGSAVIYLNDTNLAYGAVMVGNVSGSSNAFVKIQQQNGGGTFDHAAFYTGNNSGSDFFALSSAVPSPATLDVAFCGNVAYMRITSAGGVQTYSFNYGQNFGGGGGLGTYGTASLDNYVPYVGGCSAIKTAFAHARVITHADSVRDLSK